MGGLVIPNRHPQPADNTGKILNPETGLSAVGETEINKGEPLKTLEDVGLSEDQLDEIQKNDDNAVFNQLLHDSAASAGINNSTKGTTWSSHPIQNFSIGRFNFVKSVLTLTKDSDIEEFETLLADIPAPNRILIKKVDNDLAGSIAAAHAEARAIRGLDGTSARAALESLRGKVATVGTEELDKNLGQVTGPGGVGFQERGGLDENFQQTPKLTPDPTAEAAAAEGKNVDGTDAGSAE